MREEIRDLILETTAKDDNFECHYDLYDRLDYLGRVHEIIDSNVDVYHYDLRKWAVDNYHWIDHALTEGFVAEDADFHQMIQAGQYQALELEASQIVNELFKQMRGIHFNIDQTETL